MTPELAALVVKDYVLPMFEGSQPRKSKVKNGPVVENFKLSTHLQQELVQLRERLAEEIEEKQELQNSLTLQIKEAAKYKRLYTRA